MIKINSSRLGGTLTIAKQIELLSNFNIRVGCYFSVLSDALIQGSKSFIPYGKVNNFGLEFGLNYLF